jgi:hypothetical protein
MRFVTVWRHVFSAFLAIAGFAAAGAHAANWTVIGWNDLGMHCMDADYNVFAILPPYNTIHAQVIGPDGKVVTTLGTANVGYRATADAAASITTSSIGRTAFWATCPQIFGVAPALDQGLAGYQMPGAANLEQPMHFDTAPPWYSAVGIPITPYDDAGHKNAYPMMRLTARDVVGTALASTDVVLPVSDEMDCRACHASSSGAAAKPKAGWVNLADPQRDYRLNILRLHDELQLTNGSYSAALNTLSLNPAGLYASAVDDHHPMLCASCHASNALPGTGIAGITPLTEAMHAGHAAVSDPLTSLTLGASANRSACYRCHPGSTTQCLRGAMGRAVAADGTLAMQCQSCHGSMATVGAHGRLGWLEEPRCDNCHTGTATLNSGQIRYTNAFATGGVLRTAADATFATNDGAPAPGLSLYRFSFGHGGLACEACHGPTHAEAPSTHANDNVQNIVLQGHEGVLAECGVCHRSAPATGLGGPHNLHPLGQTWATQHGDFVEANGNAACAACHGGDFRGSVLSAMQADRTLTTSYGTKTLWRGERIGCYLCHNGPSSETPSPNTPPVVADRSIQGDNTPAIALTLSATDSNGDTLTLRVVDQPAEGTVAFDGHNATYFPPPAFSGSMTFTYAASDGKAESNLGRVTIMVDRVFANGFE